MNSDPEFLVHALSDALHTGIAEEMAQAIEDLILAIKAGEVVVCYPPESDDERTADGLSMRDMHEDEDIEQLELDFSSLEEYERITSMADVED